MTGLWRVPVAVTRVYFVVEVDLPAELISKRVGVEPSSSRRFHQRLADRELTEWKLDLEMGPNSIQVVDDACRRLVDFGEGVATNVSRLVDGGGNAALVIAQRVTGNPESTGIALSTQLIHWLALAKAWISIDQTVALEDDWPA